jgi:hypothetical protein
MSGGSSGMAMRTTGADGRSTAKDFAKLGGSTQFIPGENVYNMHCTYTGKYPHFLLYIYGLFNIFLIWR